MSVDQETGSEQRGVYQEEERRFGESVGVDFSETYLRLKGPVNRARVLESGQGDPLLLVHGGGGVAAQWLPLFPHLPGRRLLAVDRPGCGLTDGFKYTHTKSVRDHSTAFLTSVLDALELPTVSIVANSIGGLWSLWFALDHPDRVKSLTLAGCPALAVGTSAPMPLRVISRRGFGALLERPATAKSMRRVMKMMGHDPDALESHWPGILELSAQADSLPGAGASFRSLVWRICRLRGARPDCALNEGELAHLAIKPSLAWGSNDPFGNLDAARRFVAATGATLTVAGHGHLPWLDDPETVASAVH